MTLKSLSSSAGEGNDSSQKELVQVIVNEAQRQWDWALSLAGRSNAQQTAVQVPLTVYHKNAAEKKDEDGVSRGFDHHHELVKEEGILRRVFSRTMALGPVPQHSDLRD